MPELLTVDALFGEMPVAPSPANRLRFNVDGSKVAFLVSAEETRGRLDLWIADCAKGQAKCLFDTGTLRLGATSDADRERQERQRQFAFGVTTYEWFPDGQSLLVPIGNLVLRVMLDGQYQTLDVPHEDRGDLRLSTTGRWLTYAAQGNLYLYEMATGMVTAVTQDGGDSISHGLAEFIAQEEMHRFEGYWWAPDDSRLVFTRVDEAPIPETMRLEVVADEVVAVPQRYAYAGGPNAKVSLHTFDLTTRQTRELDIGLGAEDYLARVNFIGTKLTVQVQDRQQQSLELRGESSNSEFETWIKESSSSWINLNDNLRAVGADRFLWTSEREGLARLYIADSKTETSIRPASPPDLHICSVLASSETTAWVQGWQHNPIERHLYTVDLEAATARRLTSTPGWHEGAWHQSTARFACNWSDSATPHQVQLHEFSRPTSKLTLHQLRPQHAVFSYTQVAPVFGSTTASDGQQLYWRVTPPIEVTQKTAEGQRFPVIVYVYGGPGAQKVCNAWSPALQQLLSHAGFGVLELDNRGSANRGRTFEAPLHLHMGGVEVDDQLLGLSVLDNFAWADLSRIGIFGHSYGGFMTLMCLCRAGDRFKAGAAVAPVSDWRLYDTHYTERYLGNPAVDPTAYELSSVLPYLQQLSRPLLLVHGMADDNVLVTHTTKVMRELQRLGKPFELMLYPGSRHALQERDVSRHRFTQLLDFFRRSL